MTVLRGAGPVDPGDRNPQGPEGYDTRWLDLRAPADTRSRSTTLLRRLADLLDGGPDPTRGVRTPRLLDVGCGAGAMQRWCATHLPAGTRWTLLDPDAELLEVATARAEGPVTAVVGTVADLPAVLRMTGEDRVDAVVCSALLDVLPPDEVEQLVAEVARAGVPLLASLTVTGRVTLDPPHPLDEVAVAAVHRTATATGATGPAALDVLRRAAGRHALRPVEERTPWHLDPVDDAPMVGAWADGFLAAALAGAPPASVGPPPGSAADLTAWADRRRAQARSGRLAVVVEHVDVLLGPEPVLREPVLREPVSDVAGPG